jgi:GntR family transcriptional regulator, transcriptional repressor for pyruvate dehydrogenase complex
MAKKDDSGAAVITRPRRVERPRKMAILLAYQIVDEIVKDDLPVGTMMPTEREMLANYGVARATLREALRFLEMQGAIEIKTGAGGGPVLSQPGFRPLAGALALVLQLERTSFRAVMDARLELEPMLARRAAIHRTDEDLADLSELIDAMEGSDAGSEDFLEQNRRFHIRIAQTGGNPVLYHIIGSLSWIEDGTAIGIGYARGTHKPIQAAHRRVYDAIEAKKPDVAEAAMRKHVEEAIKYAEKHYRPVLDQPVPWSKVEA